MFPIMLMLLFGGFMTAMAFGLFAPEAAEEPADTQDPDSANLDPDPPDPDALDPVAFFAEFQAGPGVGGTDPASTRTMSTGAPRPSPRATT